MKQADYTGNVIAKLSKYVSKSKCRFFQIPFYRKLFKNKIGRQTGFQATFFSEFFHKNSSFVI